MGHAENHSEEHDRKALSKLFQRIDKDGSGQLTLRELIEGARHDKAFQSRFLGFVKDCFEFSPVDFRVRMGEDVSFIVTPKTHPRFESHGH